MQLVPDHLALLTLARHQVLDEEISSPKDNRLSSYQIPFSITIVRQANPYSLVMTV
jgi:hypothetical protein